MLYSQTYSRPIYKHAFDFSEYCSHYSDACIIIIIIVCTYERYIDTRYVAKHHLDAQSTVLMCNIRHVTLQSPLATPRISAYCCCAACWLLWLPVGACLGQSLFLLWRHSLPFSVVFRGALGLIVRFVRNLSLAIWIVAEAMSLRHSLSTSTATFG